LTDPSTGTDGATSALVAEFATRFSSPARRVVTGALSGESARREAFTELAADPELPPAGIIVFVGKRPFDDTDPDGALEHARELTWSTWATARTAVDNPAGKPPRLWLVTRNGLPVRDDEPGDPAVGALKGLIRNWRFPGEAARVLADEPDLTVTLVDLDAAEAPSNLAATLLTELDSPAGDDVIAWRDQRRYSERLTRATLDSAGREAVVRPDGAYIVTGGLGGLGMVVVRWLAQRGAGRLVLNGRTEPSDAQRKDLDDLANGAEIVFVPGDIAAPGVAEQLVAAAEETGRPLRGAVHTAGVSGDGVVATHTRDSLERVWAPKVTGAIRLHAATADRPLDWWAGFSSMATLLGLPGQAAYTTANAWLDALMAWRRASGLPAIAINWGQWSNAGMSHKLTYSLLDPITPGEGTEALNSLVGGGLTRVGVGRLRLDRAAAATPGFSELGYFKKMIPDVSMQVSTHSAADRPAADEPDRSAAAVPDWPQIPAEDRLSELLVRLQAMLARELRMAAAAIDVDRPFPELGLDSMMAMTILKEMQRLVGADLSASMFWNHPTTSALATYLLDKLPPPQVPRDDSEGAAGTVADSAGGVLDELFDSVESASAG
jgi:phthiocerol/phenolphthiocerol synthesis type-I polyketide synthase D